MLGGPHSYDGAMPRPSNDSLVNQAKAAIRRDILRGAFLPGEHLPLVKLAKQYVTSTTVIREALMQMSRHFLVQNTPHAGFSVPHLSLDQLVDLNRLRCHNEELAIRMAIERSTVLWESQLIASLHTLKNTPIWVEASPALVGDAAPERELSDAWLIAVKDFHRELISACGVPFLLEVADALEDAVSLYRWWANESRQAVVRALDHEHQDIVAAVLAKDSPTAERLLTQHYTDSVQIILDAGLRDYHQPAEDLWQEGEPRGVLPRLDPTH